MVKLQEVEDEHFTEDQPAPSAKAALPKDVLLADEDDDDMAYSDTDSSITDGSGAVALASGNDADDGDDEGRAVEDETLLDRFYALRDMIPPRRRAALSSSVVTGRDWVRAGLRVGGKTLWVVSTSVMMVGMTYALAFADEAQAVEAEKEMRMQQAANEILAPGATSVINQQVGGGGGGAVPADDPARVSR